MKTNFLICYHMVRVLIHTTNPQNNIYLSYIINHTSSIIRCLLTPNEAQSSKVSVLTLRHPAGVVAIL